jgi:amidophosphoribosyltransferase
MGGFFGITSKHDCMTDVFFGTDYHSHLGTRRGGMAAFDPEIGLQREIHSIENAPFRTRFANIFNEMKGNSVIGCISDSDPQPMMVRSNLGTYAICTVGVINNSKQLIDQYLSFSGGHFDAMTGGKVNSTELMAALIDQKSSFEEGIAFAQKQIVGTANVLILTEDGSLITARDRMGRIPVSIGRREDGYAVSFEEFAYEKLGFTFEKELGPGEIVKLTPDSLTVLSPARKKKRICAFLWSYYGYPSSDYEGVNVETMRYRNGEIMARDEIAMGRLPKVDYVCGVPDSGVPHAIGFSNRSGKPYARAFIKYTPTWPRSFMPENQAVRNKVAKMKQLPVNTLIKGKKLLFVDDSIVRGTQLRETVEFLYESGAQEVHMRSACPPIMYSCKFLNFSRGESEMDLIARRIIQELEGDEGQAHIEEYADAKTERGQCLLKSICEKLGFDSLGYQSLDGLLEAIGLDRENVCTYCWTGKE